MQNYFNSEIKIPDKLYFKIGEVSEIAGIPASVIRFWETEFPKINPKRTSSGQRHYKKGDVELVLRIKHLLYDKKFTIQGARQFLGSEKFENKSSSSVIEDLRRQLIDIRNILNG
ncbi:MAG: MerR family transcriptional regulator [Desulfobacteraceae bacterium]|nr:MAG: MerR family transcriptional regulator [Desulfobacteraceae bacterium]